MIRSFVRRLAPWLLLVFCAVSMLWTGGKALELTWALVFVAWTLAFAGVFYRRVAEPTVPIELLATLGLFILWSVLSFFFSQATNYGLDEIVREGSFALIFLWIVREMRAEEGRRFTDRFISLISLTTLLACIVGVMVYVLQPVNRFVGTFFNPRFTPDYWPNAWADELILIWPVLFLWSTEARTERSVILRLLSLAFVIGCLFLSYSRGGLLTFAAQIVLLAGIALWKQRHNLHSVSVRRVTVAVSCVLLIATGFFFATNVLRAQFHPVQSVSEKVTFTAAEGTSSISERAQFWDESIVLTKKKPLFGWGPYSFRFVQPHLQQGILATSDHPHNVFLKLAMERGVLSAVFFFLFLLFIGVRVARSIKRPSATEAFQLRQLLLSVGCIGLLAHNLIDYNLQFVGVSLPFWIFLGLLVSEGGDTALEPTVLRFNVGKKIVKTMEFVCATALLFVVMRETPFIIESSIARAAEAQGNDEKAAQWYERAKGAWFGRDAELGRANTLLALGRADEALATLQTLRTHNTIDGRVEQMIGRVMLKEKPQEALQHLAVAFAWNGQNDLGILLSVLQALDASPSEMTVDWRDRVVSTLTAYEQAIKGNVHYIALSHNVEDFKQSAEIASRLFPDDAPKIELLDASVERHSTEARASKTVERGILW